MDLAGVLMSVFVALPLFHFLFQLALSTIGDSHRYSFVRPNDCLPVP
jgi:preprotein translocase subunit SecD